MEKILVKLAMIAVLSLFGKPLIEVILCHDEKCKQTAVIVLNKVLFVPWKPISIFPNEAKRFRP